MCCLAFLNFEISVRSRSRDINERLRNSTPPMERGESWSRLPYQKKKQCVKATARCQRSLREVRGVGGTFFSRPICFGSMSAHPVARKGERLWGEEGVGPHPFYRDQGGGGGEPPSCALPNSHHLLSKRAAPEFSLKPVLADGIRAAWGRNVFGLCVVLAQNPATQYAASLLYLLVATFLHDLSDAEVNLEPRHAVNQLQHE